MRRRPFVTADELHPHAPNLCFCPSCLRLGGRARRLLMLRKLGALRKRMRVHFNPHNATRRGARA